jgi:hypothetical protein
MKATDHELLMALEQRLRHGVRYARAPELAIEDAQELLTPLKAVRQSREERETNG